MCSDVFLRDKVVGIDMDPVTAENMKLLQDEFPGRFVPIHGKFSEVESLLKSMENPVAHVDAILADIGPSSVQLDSARGFRPLEIEEFQTAPLDMRMNPDDPNTKTGAELLAESSVEDLERIFSEITTTRVTPIEIAKAIKDVHDKGYSIESTEDLAKVIRSIFPVNLQLHAFHVTKRVFGAIRAEVNREIPELIDGLSASERILKPGGKLAVISFTPKETGMIRSFFVFSTFGVFMKPDTLTDRVIFPQLYKKIYENPPPAPASEEKQPENVIPFRSHAFLRDIVPEAKTHLWKDSPIAPFSDSKEIRNPADENPRARSSILHTGVRTIFSEKPVEWKSLVTSIGNSKKPL